tara:strand:+ start:650 stop:799 length:150 start_codon:yes stop_codon:yes gene_type:complete
MIQSKNVTGVEKKKRIKDKIQRFKLMLLRVVYTIVVLGVVFYLSFTLHT